MATDQLGIEKPSKKKRDSVAIYAKIAMDIANRIVNGEIPEGKRLSGRSLMSSEYGVSPETIRRAFSLLEELQVVQVFQNSGVLVHSKENAAKYIARHGNRNATRTLLVRMRELIEEHENIERELFDITKSLIDSTERFTASNPFYTFECTLEPLSSTLHKTLGELSFWQQTHATVIAIRREGSIILSPGPDIVLEALDVLVLVGDQASRTAVEAFIQ
jgi:K+/H+ antiporter YhaU regulatory subunit KhtT